MEVKEVAKKAKKVKKVKIRYTVENGRSGILKIGSGRVAMGEKGTFELSPAQLAELMNTAGVTLTKYSDPKPKSTTTTASGDTPSEATARSSRATKSKETK